MNESETQDSENDAGDGKDPLCFAGMSDSDSSPESEDSLELSESESITDVTPLNSPYCDSPLPQARSSDMTQIKDYCDENGREVNVLMQAIRKLEVEPATKGRAKSMFRKKKGDPCPSDGVRRMDSDSSLLKHVMSQQGRVKSSSSQERLLHRRSTVINRHGQMPSAEGDSKVLPSTSVSSRPAKEMSQVHRQVKCLSHPACSPYPYGVLETATVRCGNNLTALEHSPSGQAALFASNPEAVPNIDSKVTAH